MSRILMLARKTQPNFVPIPFHAGDIVEQWCHWEGEFVLGAQVVGQKYQVVSVYSTMVEMRTLGGKGKIFSQANCADYVRSHPTSPMTEQIFIEYRKVTA